MKFTLIGCGVLGGAILDALINNNVLKPEEITIIEMYPNPNTTKFQQLGAKLLTQISELTEIIELVLLAVKPQQCKLAMSDLQQFITPNSLVISIMAGIKINTIGSILGECQIIRVMPNTPCQIQVGMSGYYGTSNVTEQSFTICEQILSCMGKTLRLSSEEDLDPLTAISGSGPAYVFYLAESLQIAGKQFGFNEEQSKLLAIQTLLGAANLLAGSDNSAEELRRKVTSPGGTTEAAIKSFDQSGIKELLVKGMDQARMRSIELAKI